MVVAALGIGWAVAGIVVAGGAVLFPFILEGWMAVRYAVGARDGRGLVSRRYRGVRTMAWSFAWVKTRLERIVALHVE